MSAIIIMRTYSLKLVFLAMLVLSAEFVVAQTRSIIPKLEEVKANEQTVFLLHVNAEQEKFVDASNRFQPTVQGGTIVSDEAWGGCLKFGDAVKTGITLKDDGKLDFRGGLTLDAWVYFEQAPPTKPVPLALKVGSFAWDIGKGKLNTSWLVFPSEPIHTTTPTQFKYFPVGGDTINGLMQLPLKKWTRLTLSYDQPLGCVTNLIDGMVDRQRFRYRGPERMQCDGKSEIQLLSGFQHCRIGAIRLNTGRPRILTPCMQVYVQQLPYQQQVQLTFDQIDSDLPLPIEVTLVWEKATGEAATIKTISLDSHAKHNILLDLPSWKNSLHTIHVHANAAGRSCYSRSHRIANVQPTGSIQIHEDLTLSHCGEKIFPLLAYHALPPDFPQLSELGFNVLLNDFNIRQQTGKDEAAYHALLKESLTAAKHNKLLLLAVANSDYNKLSNIFVAKEQPALFGWYGADEPWGDLTRLVESYNTIKMLEPHQPVLIVQNNYSRLPETAQGADIIGVDPYPIPNVSLRAVVDATQAAVRATSGKKPVWTVLPQYHTKVPTREELRCMAWLAIASGANGLGFFDWDERLKQAETGELRGWYTKEHPEQVKFLRVVLQELRSQNAFLLAPRSATQPAKSTNPAIHGLLKEVEGKQLLLLVNDSRREETAELVLPSVKQFKPWPLNQESPAATIELQDGKASVTLPALGTAMWELSVPSQH
jgi:hypothetical protein